MAKIASVIGENAEYWEEKAKCVKSLDDCPKNSQVIEIDNGYLCILQLS